MPSCQGGRTRRMLTVETSRKSRLAARDKKSMRQIVRDLRLSRNTVSRVGITLRDRVSCVFRQRAVNLFDTLRNGTVDRRPSAYCSCDLLARSGLAAGSSPVAIVEFLLRHLWRNSLYEPSANAGRSPPPRKPTALDMPSIVLSNRPSLGESTRRCYYHAAERWGFSAC